MLKYSYEQIQNAKQIINDALNQQEAFYSFLEKNKLFNEYWHPGCGASHGGIFTLKNDLKIENGHVSFGGDIECCGDWCYSSELDIPYEYFADPENHLEELKTLINDAIKKRNDANELQRKEQEEKRRIQQEENEAKLFEILKAKYG